MEGEDGRVHLDPTALWQSGGAGGNQELRHQGDIQAQVSYGKCGSSVGSAPRWESSGLVVESQRLTLFPVRSIHVKKFAVVGFLCQYVGRKI